MTKFFLLLLCLLGQGLRADDAAQALSPAAAAGALQDQDVYYGPDEQDVSASAQSAASPAPTPAPTGDLGSALTRASVSAFEWGHPERPLVGAELFINGQFLGRSPLRLTGRVVDRSSVVTARLDGYSEALRGRVQVPAEGEIRVAMASENAAGWYTTPSWVLGLGLLGASLAVYRADNTGPGLALVGGGVSVIAVSQLVARFFHLPALRRAVQDYNSRPEPAPAP